MRMQSGFFFPVSLIYVFLLTKPGLMLFLCPGVLWLPPRSAFAWAQRGTCGSQQGFGASHQRPWGLKGEAVNVQDSKVNKVDYPEVSFSHWCIRAGTACPNGLILLDSVPSMWPPTAATLTFCGRVRNLHSLEKGRTSNPLKGQKQSLFIYLWRFKKNVLLI